jgi:hypothetical protein
MHPVGQRKCCHCNEFFKPDPRQRERQRFCAAAPCRRASKAVSQRRWLRRPENRDHFCGPENVERVRAWRAAHPGYGKRTKQEQAVLQEMMNAQVPPAQEPAPSDDEVPLQETWQAQPPLLVGLISHLTGTALQEEMAPMIRQLIARGQALLEPNLKNHDRKTSHQSKACTAGAVAL